MARITFQPLGLAFECSDGESVFEVGRRNGVPIATACTGQASCGLCRVRVLDGQDNLVPFNSLETRHLGAGERAAGQRLSCQARVRGGDVVVAIPLLHEID